MTTTFETIKKKLDEEKIPYTILEHAQVSTSEEAAMVRGYGKAGMKIGAKAMIIRSEGKFYQFVLPGDRKLDFKKIKTVLGTESASLATPREVEEVIGCKVGAVPPCGTLLGITTYVDSHLLDNEEIAFNAGKHTASITMKTADWMKIIEPVVADFSQK